MNRILLILILLLTLTGEGCIHTYPSGEEEDPTEIQLAFDISFELEQEYINHFYESTRSSSRRYRIAIELIGENPEVIHHEIVTEAINLENETIHILIPSKVKPEKYRAAVWCSPLSEDEGTGGFDLSDLSHVSPYIFLSDFTDTEGVVYCSGDIDLTGYRNAIDAKHIHRLVARSPFARINIVSTDNNAFLDYAGKFIANGEKYTVSILYENPYAAAFNAIDGKPCDLLPDIEEKRPLPTLFSSQNTIMTLNIFAGNELEEIPVSLLIYNSALAILSRTRGIEIPVKSGATTTIKGDFLTNFTSSRIEIDNVWNEEITIEIK